MDPIRKAALSLARSHVRLRQLEGEETDLLETERAIYARRKRNLVALLTEHPIDRETYLAEAAPAGEPEDDEEGLHALAALLVLENDPQTNTDLP